VCHVSRARFLKIVRYVGVGSVALCLVAAGAVTYFLATLDAKAYVPELARKVHESIGRTLTVPGDVKISWWPDLAIETGPLALSERNGSDVFARVASARIRVKLRPLLSGDVIVLGLDVRGAHVNIVRDAAGRLNVDDLLGREGPPSHFDVGY